MKGGPKILGGAMNPDAMILLVIKHAKFISFIGGYTLMELFRKSDN